MTFTVSLEALPDLMDYLASQGIRAERGPTDDIRRSCVVICERDPWPDDDEPWDDIAPPAPEGER